MKKTILFTLTALAFPAAILFQGSASSALAAPELVIGEKRIPPGIIFIFEGAVKDKILPPHLHLAENKTDVHLEARVNWGKGSLPAGSLPAGTPPEGFVPYLKIKAKVINERTGKSLTIKLLPHINLIDNFHYARNIKLPGARTDLYRVIFFVRPPALSKLALHRDWTKLYGKSLFQPQKFSFRGINFETIAKATRK